MKSCNDIPFSNKDRARQLNRISASSSIDLIVIGGGITGAGIALDSSLRGIRTLLIEKGDFASGTSSKSTKLIHGGLRYLKQFEIGLVRESGLERAVVHQNIPHLVHPERMLLPIVRDGGFGKLTASMAVGVYDFLANVNKSDKKKVLKKSEALAAEPLLPASRLEGAVAYSEYRTDDARLTIELIKAARRNGAEAFNYLEVTGISGNGNDRNEGISLHCKDKLGGMEISFNARAVVSAAGPWVDEVRSLLGPVLGKRLYLTKGVHIVVAHKDLPVKSAIYFDALDGRMIFVIPRTKVCYIGTTDTEYKGDPDNVKCSLDDVQYLLKNVNQYFININLELSDILSSWAGLRPLIHEEGKGASELSRKDEIFISSNGMVSIAGGKLTGYRKMAERVVDLLQEKGMVSSASKGETKDYSIHASPFRNYEEYNSFKDKLFLEYNKKGVDKDVVTYLLDNYGKHAEYILFHTNYNDDINRSILRTEIIFTLDFESATRTDDFFSRRSGLLYFNPDRVKRNFDLILDTFAEYFNLTPVEKDQEKERMIRIISETTGFE